MRRREQGASLAETLVTVTVLSLLTSVAYTMFRAGATFQSHGMREAEVARNLALGLHHVARELPEAVPIYDLNGALYTPPGGSPVVAVSSPASAGTTASELIFLELDPGKVSPTDLADFVATDPSNYRQIRYYASGEDLLREVRPYDSLSGQFTAVAAASVITNVPDHALSLAVTAVDPNQANYVDGIAYRVRLGATRTGAASPTGEVSAYVYLRSQT